ASQGAESFFQDHAPLVPQREGKADELMAIADPGDTVLVPSIGARSCLIVGEVLPGVAVRAVVLANSSPFALAQVRCTPFPGMTTGARLLESFFFGGHCSMSDRMSVRLRLFSKRRQHFRICSQFVPRQHVWCHVRTRGDQLGDNGVISV